MINKNILEIIKKNGYNVDDILLYLLSLHYNLNTTYIPELVKKQTNVLGIINRDFDKGTIKWIVPLFDSESSPQIVATWDWVHTEYRKLFIDIRRDAGGDKASCISKMKKFFAENPEVRKNDVLDAAKMYIESFASGKDNPKYLQRADYFIVKAVKAEGTSTKESRLSQFIELLEPEKRGSNRNMKGLM